MLRKFRSPLPSPLPSPPLLSSPLLSSRPLHSFLQYSGAFKSRWEIHCGFLSSSLSLSLTLQAIITLKYHDSAVSLLKHTQANMEQKDASRYHPVKAKLSQDITEQNPAEQKRTEENRREQKRREENRRAPSAACRRENILPASHTRRTWRETHTHTHARTQVSSARAAGHFDQLQAASGRGEGGAISVLSSFEKKTRMGLFGARERDGEKENGGVAS